MEVSVSNPLLSAGVSASLNLPQVLVAGAHKDNISQRLREDRRVVVWEIHDGRIDKKSTFPATVRFVLVMRAITGTSAGRHVVDLAKKAGIEYQVGIGPGQTRKFLEEAFPKSSRVAAKAPSAASVESVAADELSAAEPVPAVSPTESVATDKSSTAPPVPATKRVTPDELVNLVADHADFTAEPRMREIQKVFARICLDGYDVEERQVTRAYYKAFEILTNRARERRKRRELRELQLRTPILPKPATADEVPVVAASPEIALPALPKVIVPAASPEPVTEPVSSAAMEEQRRTKRGELKDLVQELADFLDTDKEIALILATARERGVPTTQPSVANAYYRARREALSGGKVRPISLARRLRASLDEMGSGVDLLISTMAMQKSSNEELATVRRSLTETQQRLEAAEEEVTKLRTRFAELQQSLDEERNLRVEAESKLSAIFSLSGKKKS